MQDYDIAFVPAFGLDTLTLTGRYRPKRRKWQPSIEFTTVEKNLHPYPAMAFVPIPESD
jgi:hypothetical protein